MLPSKYFFFRDGNGGGGEGPGSTYPCSNKECTCPVGNGRVPSAEHHLGVDQKRRGHQVEECKQGAQHCVLTMGKKHKGGEGVSADDAHHNEKLKEREVCVHTLLIQ